MITITSPHDGKKFFSASIPDLRFTISDTWAVVGISVDGTSIYEETLMPVGGAITVDDLPGMLGLFAERSLVIDVTVSITEQKQGEGQTIYIFGEPYTTPGTITTTGTKTVSFQVLFCNADFGVTADEFYDNHFLSILMGPKVTAMGRLEYLHYYGSDTARCTATYTDGSILVFSLSASGGNSQYTQLDVSPDNFAAAGKQLASYVVEAGARSQIFEIDMQQPDCAPIMIFDNSFGVQELLYCTGVHKVAPEYKRMSARFGGLLRNYDIEETRTFQANTGPLTTAMANWADELFRSKEVYVVNVYNGQVTNSNEGREVVITDCKSENSNEDDYMPRFTFSYQYAQRIHNVIDLKREGRIFDNTFDNTFN